MMSTTAAGGTSRPPAKYATEITQMLFVLGQPKEISDSVLQCVEDIVRSSLLDLLSQARVLALKRGSSSRSTPEDFLFLLRHDPARLSRLTTYLSWRDVRKKTKDAEAAESGDFEALELGGEGAILDKVLRTHKQRIPIPWDLSSLSGLGEESDDDEERTEEPDEAAAFQGGKERLKQLDDLTRNMTKEAYLTFAESRQATFSHKKTKRFKDFLNTASIGEIPSDDVLDVLGFLGYEMVKSICDAGVTAQLSAAQAREAVKLAAAAGKKPDARGKRRTGDSDEKARKKKRTSTGATPKEGDEKDEVDSPAASSSSPRFRDIPLSLFSAPEEESPADHFATLTTLASSLSYSTSAPRTPTLPDTAAAADGSMGPPPLPGVPPTPRAATPAPPQKQVQLELLTVEDIFNGVNALHQVERKDRSFGLKNWTAMAPSVGRRIKPRTLV